MKLQVYAFLLTSLVPQMLSATGPVLSDADVQEELAYIEQYKSLAITEMRYSGIPASITLAQALVEGRAGRSDLAISANNHFGIKCHEPSSWSGETYYAYDDDYNRKGERIKSCFRKYATVEDSYRDHSQFLMTRKYYTKLFKLDMFDYKGWCHELKAAGYATDKHYSKILIDKIEQYELYNYDQALITAPLAMEEPQPLVSDEPLNAKPQPRQDPLANIVVREFKTQDLFKEIFPDVETQKAFRYRNLRTGVVREGDTPEALAARYKISLRKLRKYNELGPNDEFVPGVYIFLEKKKKEPSRKYSNHVVKPGETIYSIAQLYGISAKRLRKNNHIPVGYEPNFGERLSLQESENLHPAKCTTKEHQYKTARYLHERATEKE